MGTRTPNPIPRTAQVPEALAALAPSFAPGIAFDVSTPPSRAQTPSTFLLTLTWQRQRFEFAAAFNPRNTPRAIDEALRQAAAKAATTKRLPMLLVPYLSPQTIDRLATEGISGLDLSGNGLVIVPPKLLLRRTGEPNRFPESRPTKFAYRGSTSLVPRIFFRCAQFTSLAAIQSEIESAGGTVVLSTVSKALARMVDDLIISRTNNQITLLQPDKLLASLLQSFEPPKPERSEQGKTTLPLPEVFRRLSPKGKKPPTPLRAVLSGASSLSQYGTGLRADQPVLYTNNLAAFRGLMADAWQPTDRFATLTVIETRDQTPFLDARPIADGTRFASPLQTYLELASSGDKREAEMAQQVRTNLLRDLSPTTGPE